MYYVGIDIGGTNLKAGLVDEHYQLVATKKMPLQFTSMEQMGETLTDMALALLEENHIARDQVASIGMGFPGSVDNRRGVVIKTVNIPIRFMPVAEMVHRRWDVPVYLGNDADCAALGEYYHYGDEKLESLILVTLGTGIGTGIILDGKIQAGFNGFGGEGGHIVIVHGGEPCTCGRKGCWERYASARALTEDTKAAMQEHSDTLMWKLVSDLDHVNAKTSFDAMAQGDELAKQVVHNWMEYVACGLANVVNTFEPEVICVGGGVSNQGETLLAPVRAYVEKETHDITGGRVPEIRACELRNDAGVIGAAALEVSI